MTRAHTHLVAAAEQREAEQAALLSAFGDPVEPQPTRRECVIDGLLDAAFAVGLGLAMAGVLLSSLGVLTP